jgi:hypothetical protein
LKFHLDKISARNTFKASPGGRQKISPEKDRNIIPFTSFFLNCPAKTVGSLSRRDHIPQAV